MSRDRLLKNSWSYSRTGLTKGVPNGLSVTRRDELAVSDVGLTVCGKKDFLMLLFHFFFAIFVSNM